YRTTGRSLSGAQVRAPPAPGLAPRHPRRRLGHRREPPGPLHRARLGGEHDPSGYRLSPLSLGRTKERQPAHHRGSGPDLEDPRVQGVRRTGPESGRVAGVRGRARTTAVKEPERTMPVPETLEFFVDPGRCIG